MDFQEIGWENVDWILLVQDSNQRQSLQNIVMNLWVKKNVGNLTSQETIISSRSNPLYGVPEKLFRKE
jgi:hypothetical protein